MSKHTHQFVESYDGIAAFGMDRKSDEETLIYYLQKFSDDTLINTLIKRFSDTELEEIYLFINRFLKNHLTEQEYHHLFLKDS